MNSNFSNAAFENVMYGNNNLNSWLSTVKNNNSNLFEGMNPPMSESMGPKNSSDRYQADQLQKMMEQGRMNSNEDQQSVMCLMQQIELYKELLAQVTYQNQLLSRDIGIKQSPMGSFGGMGSMNYHLPQHQQQMQMPMNYGGMSGHPMMMGMNSMKEQGSGREAMAMASKEGPGAQTNNYEIIKNMVL